MARKLTTCLSLPDGQPSHSSRFVRLLRENITRSQRVLGLQVLEVLCVIGSFLGGHPFQQRPFVCCLLLQKSSLRFVVLCPVCRLRFALYPRPSDIVLQERHTQHNVLSSL